MTANECPRDQSRARTSKQRNGRASSQPSVAETTSKKAADELVKKVLASLARQDSKVKEFIDKAGR